MLIGNIVSKKNLLLPASDNTKINALICCSDNSVDIYKSVDILRVCLM